MKVAMLTHSTKPRGGVVHALKLSERLRVLGADITVYALSRADVPLTSEGFYREVSVPFEIFRFEWHSDLMTRLERMIDAYVRNLPRNADVYHAQDCVGGTALARLAAEGVLKAPAFRTIHHVDDVAEPRLYEFEKQAVNHAEHRFVVSQYWKDALARGYGFDAVVTYNGIDVEDFAELPARESARPTVLFVGGLEPRKGLEYLVLAMRQIVDEFADARLVAVAKPSFKGTEEWRWFLELADRTGVAANVEFHESVSQQELLGFYAGCDLLALPSRMEGWGLVLMEAMACGKPVVASAVGGVPELVRDGVEGLLVHPCDPQALASAIIRLLKDAELRDRMGREGRQRARSFSWDRTARTVLDAYQTAVRKTPRNPP